MSLEVPDSIPMRQVTEPFCGSVALFNVDETAESYALAGKTITFDTSVDDAVVQNNTPKKLADAFHSSLLCIDEGQPVSDFEQQVSLQVQFENMCSTSKPVVFIPCDELLYGTCILISDALNDFSAMTTHLNSAFNVDEELQAASWIAFNDW